MVVLYLFGLPVPKVGLVSILIIFAGIVLVNLSGPTAAEQQSSATIGMILVLISAFAYPLGNQLLHGARHGRGYFKLRSASPVLSDAASCVLLLSLGSVPFWRAGHCRRGCHAGRRGIVCPAWRSVAFIGGVAGNTRGRRPDTPGYRHSGLRFRRADSSWRTRRR
jgi:drug/metabolite transporter (DMT)-like permease